jgi:hypothetical protein
MGIGILACSPPAADAHIHRDARHWPSRCSRSVEASSMRHATRVAWRRQRACTCRRRRWCPGRRSGRGGSVAAGGSVGPQPRGGPRRGHGAFTALLGPARCAAGGATVAVTLSALLRVLLAAAALARASKAAALSLTVLRSAAPHPPRMTCGKRTGDRRAHWSAQLRAGAGLVGPSSDVSGLLVRRGCRDDGRGGRHQGW